MELLCILIVELVTQLSAFVKVLKTVFYKGSIFLYVNYTLNMLGGGQVHKEYIRFKKKKERKMFSADKTSSGVF